ncbi:MAG: O-antigen ligase family protein [Clostridia bacterium]|nr:O-antigen ligase family protein [Clostridia bacterium]
MSSMIINGLSGLWLRTDKIIRSSLTFRLFTIASDFIARVAKGSFIYRYFTKPVKYENPAVKRSLAYRALAYASGKSSGFLTRAANRLAAALRSSVILARTHDFFFRIHLQPTRTIGLATAAAAAAILALSAIFIKTSVLTIAASAFLGVVSLLLFVSGNTLWGIICESMTFRMFFGSTCPSFENGGKHLEKSQRHHIIPVMLGILAGSFLVFLPPLYAVAAIAAILGIPMVIVRPVTGLAALAVSLAFIPTTAAAGLIIVIWAGVLLNAVTGRISLRDAFLKGRAALVFILIILSGGLISFAIAESMPIALIYMLFISAVFLFIILVKTKVLLKSLVLSIVLSALGTGVIGVYQYVSGNIEIGWIDSEMFEGMVRIYSTFENPNVYGEYLLLVIPLCLALFFGSVRKTYKVFWMGTGIVLAVALLMTMSRGCWIGLAAGIILYFIIADRRFLWVLPIALVAMPFVLPQSVLSRIMSVGNLEDSSSLYRLYIWLGTFSMLRDYWFTGVGLGPKAFSGIYSAYAYNGVPAPHAHNLFLHVLSETGIAGLLGLIWVSLTGYKNSISTSLKKRGFDLHLGAALAASMTGFIVQGMFDNVFYNYRVYLMFWIIIAFAYSYALAGKKGSVADNEQD